MQLDKDQQIIPLPLGGEWTSGDPSLIPPGTVRKMENMISRPGPRWVKRPAFVAEAASVTSNFLGFANWEDTTNQATRLLAFYQNGGTFLNEFRVKDVGAETYGSAITGLGGVGSPSSFTNFRGVVYFTLGTNSTGVPVALDSYDGTSLNTAPLGGETLQCAAIASFIDRLFLGYVSASVVNQLGTSVMYDSTAWSNTTTTTTNITNGTSVTSRITPTATTLSKIYKADVYTIAAATTHTQLVFRSDLRSVSPSNSMPMTTQIYYSQAWVANTAYSVGHVRVPTTAGGNGFRYRVTVAGTSANPTEPPWPTTVGTTVVDNTVTWICDGPDSVGSSEFTLLSLSDQPNYSSYWAVASIPPMPQSSKLGVRIKFGNTATSTITLNPIDISFKDGKTDGVLSKANKGQQLTVGRFQYPFINQESTATATLVLDNDIYWTETGDPNTIRAANFYKLREAPGRVKAMVVCGGRLIVFKRRGMWVFQGTTDPDNPIIKERYFDNIGALGARSVIVYEDSLYAASEDEIYSYAPGGRPVPICGDGMRETIVSAYRAAVDSNNSDASLAMDADYRDLYVSGATDTSPSFFVYSIDRKTWSQQAVNDSNPLARVVSALIWNPSMRNMYGMWNGGHPFHFDRTATASSADSSIGATASQTSTITWALENQFGRDDVTLDGIAVWNTNTSTAAVTVTVTYGETALITKTNAVTLLAALSSDVPVRTYIPLRQTSSHFLITLTHAGNSGAGAFAFSRAEAIIRNVQPERKRAVPTQGSSSL